MCVFDLTADSFQRHLPISEKAKTVQQSDKTRPRAYIENCGKLISSWTDKRKVLQLGNFQSKRANESKHPVGGNNHLTSGLDPSEANNKVIGAL